ncbi:hypothetical protein AOLI_G00105730 [Acnodon oligacanthus]
MCNTEERKDHVSVNESSNKTVHLITKSQEVPGQDLHRELPAEPAIMVHVTRMPLLFVLFMASSAFGQVKKPGSVPDFNAFIKEQLNEVQKPMGVKPFHPKCPFGWVRYEGRCFIYFPQPLDWASAEAKCLTKGAHLVSIHNDDEYQLLKALIRVYDPKENPTWLGLNDCQKWDSWFWSDGTKYDYSKWNRNEPNHNNGECCVHMNWSDQKDWNDIPCDLAYPSVCSMDMALKL